MALIAMAAIGGLFGSTKQSPTHAGPRFPPAVEYWCSDLGKKTNEKIAKQLRDGGACYKYDASHGKASWQQQKLAPAKPKQATPSNAQRVKLTGESGQAANKPVSVVGPVFKDKYIAHASGVPEVFQRDVSMTTPSNTGSTSWLWVILAVLGVITLMVILI